MPKVTAPPPPTFPSRLVYPHEPSPTSTIRVVFQNVNNWKTNHEALRPAYSKVNADVILLAHTGLEMEDRLKMPPYITYKTKNISGPFAGVAILIKPGISHEVIQKPFYEDTIAVRIDTTTGPIILATCYHPPKA